MTTLSIPRSKRLVLYELQKTLSVQHNKKYSTEEVVHMLLEKYKSDESFKISVDECIRSYKVDKEERTSIIILPEDRIELYKLAKQKESHMYRIVSCLIETYLAKSH